MADSSISNLSGTFTTYAGTNLLVIVDVTDTTMAASGTDKKLTVGSLFSNYVFGASGSSHAAGSVPDPGSTSGTTRYLREDATWVAPSGGISIGGAISGGTEGRVLYEGTSAILADSSNLTFDGTTLNVLHGGNIILRCPFSDGTIYFEGPVILRGGTTITMVSLTGTVGIGHEGSFPSTWLTVSTNDPSEFPVIIATCSGQTSPVLTFKGTSSTTGDRNQALVDSVWNNSTDAIRTGQLNLYACDYTGTNRLGFSISSDGTQTLIGAFGATPIAKPTVSGSRGGNAALASLITALANLGFITDSTS